MHTEDSMAIAAVIDGLYAAFLANDRAGFDAHLHPQVTTWETHLPGRLRDRAALDAYRDQRDDAGARPALARLAAEPERIDVWGEVAVARYRLVAQPAAAGAVARHYRVTDVLRRTAGRWLIVHHHAELLRLEPA